MSQAKIKVEKFDGKGDYMLWKEKLLAHLEILGLLEGLEEEQASSETEDSSAETGEGVTAEAATQADAVADKSLKEKRRKARSTIILSVGDNVLRKIIKEKSAAGMIKVLDHLFMAKSLPNRIYLKQRMYSYKMSDSLTVDENINDFLRLIADLEHVKVTVSDEDQAIILLMALPKQFDQLKDTLKYGKTSLSLDEITSAIRSKELELGASGKLPRQSSDALFVQEKGRFEKKDKGGDKSKQQNKGKSKGKKTCWICGKDGHYKKQCYLWKDRNKQQNGSKERGESSNATGQITDAAALMVSEALISLGDDFKEKWIMDTGCSFHMTPRKDWFIELNESGAGRVRMANDTYSEVKGVGSIRIKNEDNSTILLKNVRYVPAMSKNLISLGTLEDQGCWFQSRDGVMKINKGCKTLMQGQKTDTFYVLRGSVLTGEVNVSVVQKDETRLWHRRLGHMSQKSMKALLKKGYLDSSKVTDLEFCEDCVYGKAHRASFGVGKHVTKERLEYIHSDLWGSPNVPLSLEAASTAVYQINRSPSSPIEFEIPEEVWTGAKPKYEELRVFGSVAYIHSDQGKLNPRAKKGVFVGYPAGVKGYKFWLVEEKKCVVTRDATFQEAKMYKHLNQLPESGTEPQSSQVPLIYEINHGDFSDLGGAEVDTEADKVEDQLTKDKEQENGSENKESQVNSELENYQLARDRVRRPKRPPVKFRESNMVEKADAESELLGFALMMTEDDDMLIAAKDMKKIKELKNLLSSEFEMKDLGEARKILGMEIKRDRVNGTLEVSQEQYLQKVLQTFRMDQSKGVLTPLGVQFKLRAATDQEFASQEEYMKSIPYSNVVGSIMYSMIGTRPDLAYPLLIYKKQDSSEIKGYCDSDYAADLDKRRSVTGYVFTAGGNVISWKSGLQKVVALSTTEAEYMALTEAIKEGVWLKGLAEELGFKQDYVEVMSDSQSAISLSKNSVHHERTKYIDVRLHFIRDKIAEGEVKVVKVSTLWNPADIFTKTVPVSKLQNALELLRISRKVKRLVLLKRVSSKGKNQKMLSSYTVELVGSEGGKAMQACVFLAAFLIICAKLEDEAKPEGVNSG
ncbi:unnamed protein product [Arabidopsis halleri]